MRLLLDTHVLIWAASDPSQLSATARALILDPANERMVSAASAWEIAIKVGTGKLTLPRPPELFMADQLAALSASLLPIELRHLGPVATLPTHHKDPFDRLLIAQSLTDGIPLVSADAAFDAYAGVVRLW